MWMDKRLKVELFCYCKKKRNCYYELITTLIFIYISLLMNLISFVYHSHVQLLYRSFWSTNTWNVEWFCCFPLFQDQENNDHMAYWLSNSSTLLFLLEHSLKAAGAATKSRKPPAATSLFGRMAQVRQDFYSHFPSLGVDIIDARTNIQMYSYYVSLRDFGRFLLLPILILVCWILYAKLRPRCQHCFSSNSSLHTWRRFMELFETIWRKICPRFFPCVSRFF